MPLVVGVTFRRVGKVYYFDPGEFELHEGDFVIAETARGVEFGEVALEPKQLPEEELVAPLKKVIRVATGDDLQHEADNRDREKHAREVCERKIADHKLPMKLLEAEYAFDGSQVTFSFSADGRVDFRELVKDVAGVLKAKVQLHQIGVRDEAKLVGGFGTCGRPLCCATFLSNFEPISMKMAKDQSLFLNPAKFSGACGKLMCCLRFEHEFYKLAQKRLPAVGAIVPLDTGRAKVVDVNAISNIITVQTEDDAQLHVHASQINMQGLCRRHGIGCNMNERNCEPLLADEDVVAARPGPTDDDLANDDAEAEPVDPDVAEIDRVLGDDQTAAGDVASVTRWRTPGEHDDHPAQRDHKPDNASDSPAQRGNPTRRGRSGGGNGEARRSQQRNRSSRRREPGSESKGQ